MTEQYYRMTLSDAIAKYQGHDLTAKGLVHFYILIKCRPDWNCFCCQDTGQIQAHLVRRIIPDYDHNRDRIPICQECNKFDRHNLMEYDSILGLTYFCAKN